MARKPQLIPAPAVAPVFEVGADPITPEDFTPEQKRKWQDTMSMMAWRAGGFQHIFYKLLANNKGEYHCVPTRRVPIAATDARNILINPDTFFGYSLAERVFIMGHEIMHNVYGDVELLHRCNKTGTVPMNDGSHKPFINDVMQRAMDYRINALLADSKMGSPPEGICLDPKIAVANDGILDVYKRLYEEEEANGKLPGKGFDIILAPGKSTGQDPQTAASQRNQQQWQVAVAAAQTIEQQRTQGSIAGALKRMFESILEPEVPWTEHIQGIFNRRVGSGSYDWRRPDRRFIVRDLHMPSRSGHGAGWLVIWGDTSGSIGAKEMDSYLGELAGIIEDVHPKRLTILWCDAAIHRIDEVEEAIDIYNIRTDPNGVGGGGGTSVRPVMEWIAQSTEVPDMFIGMTDGEVTFPKHEPTYPVIWASVQDNPTKFPWGEYVRINKRKAVA